MAESLDSYKDLEELGLDDDEELVGAFGKAANHVQTLAATTDAKTLLTLYGYYKQATEGVCNVPKPSWLDMRAKSKWEAWNNLGNMPKEKAKSLYVETVKKLDPSFEVEKSAPPPSWISVSVMQSDADDLPNAEKSLADFVKEGDLKNVERHLKYTADLNKLDKDGLSLLHWAADRGSAKVLTILLLHGADVNVRDSEGQTALHYAVSCGHLDCVRVLLENGADLSLKDNDGNEVVTLAQDDSVRSLLTQQL